MLRTWTGFFIYNVWPVALVAYTLFVGTLALRGLGVRIPFEAFTLSVCLALGTFWCASMLSAWSHRIDLRWSKPLVPALRYTRRQKWAVVGLLAGYFAMGGVPFLLTFIPILPALGLGALLLVAGCTMIQRRALRMAQLTAQPALPAGTGAGTG